MKSNKKLLIIIIAITILALTACKTPAADEEVVEAINEPVEKVDEPVIEEPIKEEPKKEGFPSPLSGIYVADESILEQRVVGVMFDNHPGARWQAGLKDAEIIYEFPVEAPYTRYLGLFLINNPESIGPIRSSRPYFVTKVLEYDAIYVRVGGSNQAMLDIKNLKIADIDGLSSSSKVFWRSKNKKMPHNLYSSMEVIRETQKQRGFRETGEFQGLKFHDDDKDLVGFTANSILIDYLRNNTTKYTYDEENKLYKRQKDGKDHIDESDSSQITAKNIIIQEVNLKVIDNEGRLQVDLVGEGKGKFFTNGAGIDITWEKKERQGKTFYYDQNGEEIILNPGTTWIQVIQKDPNIVIE